MTEDDNDNIKVIPRVDFQMYAATWDEKRTEVLTNRIDLVKVIKSDNNKIDDVDIKDAFTNDSKANEIIDRLFGFKYYSYKSFIITLVLACFACFCWTKPFIAHCYWIPLAA